MNILKVKYATFISFMCLFFLAELIVGIVANSITLQTDAFHMLSDLLALCVGFATLHLLEREKTERYTFGWVRAEIISGTINSVFLLSISFMLILENIEKVVELIIDTSNDRLEEDIDLVLIVAGAGLAINIIGIILFASEHTHHHHHDGVPLPSEEPEMSPPEIEEQLQVLKVRNLAQYAVFLHILGDTLGSVVVIAASLTIKYVEESWKFFLDPIGSCVIIVFIIYSSAKLLKRCVQILMHRWSGESQTTAIINELESLHGLHTVHEFHVWPLTNRVSVASLHIKISPNQIPDNTDRLIGDIKDILHRHGIHSSTIQPEYGDDCLEPTCRDGCEEQQCCKVDA